MHLDGAPGGNTASVGRFSSICGPRAIACPLNPRALLSIGASARFTTNAAGSSTRRRTGRSFEVCDKPAPAQCKTHGQCHAVDDNLELPHTRFPPLTYPCPSPP